MKKEKLIEKYNGCLIIKTYLGLYYAKYGCFVSMDFKTVTEVRTVIDYNNDIISKKITGQPYVSTKQKFTQLVKSKLKERNESITSMLKATEISQRAWFNISHNDSGQTRTYKKICDYLQIETIY